MTITNILHVSGVKLDLYSPSFFKGEHGKKRPINPFKLWVDGHILAYGTRINDYKETERIVFDVVDVKDIVGFTGEGDDPIGQMNSCIDTQSKEFPVLEHLIYDPPIPPSKSYNDWKYQFEVHEHQHAYWDAINRTWTPVTLTETRYIDSNNHEIKPTLIDTSVVVTAAELTSYYFDDRYDLDKNQLVDVAVNEGDNLEQVRKSLEDKYKEKFPNWDRDHPNDPIGIQLYMVDITTANKVPTSTDHDQYMMGHWLEKIDKYPRMISVDENKNIIATYGNWEEPNMEGDFEYRHSLPDAVFDFRKFVVNRKTTLPICNGLCCYPRIINEKIYANQGQRLSYNKQDRNRRWVLVDFDTVGGCTFIPLKDLDGNLTELIMPQWFSDSSHSVLLVIKGRLFLPGEFSIDNSHRLLFDITKYIAAYDVDTKICRNDKVKNTIIINPNFRYDLKTDDNSFLVIINNPRLQIVKHKCYEGSWPITKMQWGSDSHAETMKFDFDQPARGLLFDESTKSVIDYTRETQTMTFYADKFRKWGIANTHANWSSLFALSDENSHNLMSARGFVLDDVFCDRYPNIIWPRLSILDFIFRS